MSSDRIVLTLHKQSALTQLMESKTRSYLYFANNPQIDGRTLHMANLREEINELGKLIEEQPEWLTTIGLMAKEDKPLLLAAIQYLVIMVVEYFDTSNPMGGDMVERLAERIAATQAGLTLEDLALCFHKAMNAEYGKVYNRVDGGVVMGWVLDYKKERAGIAANQNEMVHLQSKTK